METDRAGSAGGAVRGSANTLLERRSNIEARNPKQIQMSELKEFYDALAFRISDFEFVLEFGIRISNF